MLLHDAPFMPPGLGRARRAVTSTATVTIADQGIVIDATSGTFSVGATAAASLGSGFSFGLYNSGTGVVTFDPTGTETVRTPAGTATTFAIRQGQGAFIQTDGANWDVILTVGISGAGGATTDNAVARFDGTSGALQNSGVIIDDSNNVTGVVALTATGATAIGTATITSTSQISSTQTTATTNALVATQTWNLHSSGTPAAGLGHNINFKCDSDTTVNRAQFEIDTAWVVATDASRTSYTRFFQYDTGAREVFRVEASGTAPMIGFLGATAVVRPTSTTDLRTALINLGLYTTGGATPLNLNGGAFTAQSATISGLTSGRVVVASTAGLLVDSASWLWNATSGITSISTNDSNTLEISDGGTTNVPQVMCLSHTTSGTPAAGFGSYILIRAKDSTTNNVSQSLFQTEWVDATHASRTAKIRLFAYDSAAREGICIQASGTAPMIGFLGAAATAKAAITGSRAGNAALASLLTELAAKGLITDSTSA